MTDDREPGPPAPPPSGWEGVRPRETNFDGPDFAHPFGRRPAPPPPKEAPDRDDRDR